MKSEIEGLFYVDAWLNDTRHLESTELHKSENAAIHEGGKFFMDWADLIKSGRVSLLLYRQLENGEAEFVRQLDESDYFETA